MNRKEKFSVDRLEDRMLLAASLGGDLLPPERMAGLAEMFIVPQGRINSGQGSLLEQLIARHRQGGGNGGGSTADVASIDGTGNNAAHPEWGSTGTQLLRTTTVEYGDGISSPAGQDRPSAREVSNAIVAQSESITNDRYLTDFVWLWGQFIDHDIDLTQNGTDPAEPINIEVPTGDPYFDPMGTGTATIDANRSIFDPSTGDSVENPRQQINEITAFIDGSMVYGSDQERADALRTFSGGKLKTSDGDLLPFNVDGFANAGGTGSNLFLAGDVRANENVALSSMHTLFVREHNRLADEIAAKNPSLSDEEIYQRARAIVTAEIQSITYNEFLPALLGEGVIGDYGGYDPSVNPGISNVFSTASYRFGHSLLSPQLLRLDESGNPIDAGALPLRDAFFAPDQLIDNGIDSLLRGLAVQNAQEVDTHLVDEVRNFLFGPPGSGGFDLASLNIQRGRDHGLADYNQVREDLGLERVTSFSQITSDPELAAALEEVYGSVDNIDVWVGGLAEDHVAGGSVGELVQTVLVDQFERLRAGDRFWYENVFKGDQLRDLQNTTLSDIIERNTGVTGLQENVFYDSSVMYFKVDEGRGPTDLKLIANNDTVSIVNARTGRTLESMPTAEVSQVRIVGSSRSNERFTVSMTGDQLDMPGGILIDGGSGRRDTVVMKSKRSDDIVVDGTNATWNGMSIMTTDIEKMSVARGRGTKPGPHGHGACRDQKDDAKDRRDDRSDHKRGPKVDVGLTDSSKSGKEKDKLKERRDGKDSSRRPDDSLLADHPAERLSAVDAVFSASRRRR